VHSPSLDIHEAKGIDMRRRLSLLLAATVAASTLVLLSPARPASAVVVCGGTGTMFVVPGLLFPVLLGVLGGPLKDHPVDILIGDANSVRSFSLLFVAGVCTHIRVPPTTFTFSGFGRLKGFCGQAAGFGTIAGQPFSFLNFGTFVLVTGHFVGIATVTPTPGTGSCLHIETPVPTGFSLPSGTTTIQFQFLGIGLNCSNALPVSETLIRVATTLLLVQPVGVHVDYGIHFFTMPQCTSPDIVL
jgi:hypothetical protein